METLYEEEGGASVVGAARGFGVQGSGRRDVSDVLGRRRIECATGDVGVSKAVGEGGSKIEDFGG